MKRKWLPRATFGLLVGLALIAVVPAHLARSATVNSGDSLNVTAILPGPAPTTPATIDSPSSDQTVTTTPFVVSGSCGPGLLVKLFDNSVLVGMATCALDGTYTINFSLVIGQNVLTVLNYDTLDQAGPASPARTITVKLPAGASSPSGNTSSSGKRSVTNPKRPGSGSSSESPGVVPGQETPNQTTTPSEPGTTPQGSSPLERIAKTTRSRWYIAAPIIALSSFALIWLIKLRWPNWFIFGKRRKNPPPDDLPPQD